VEVQLDFHTLSQKFNILVIPNVSAQGKSYKYDFMKIHDGHKLCTKSRFDRFFTHHLGLWCIILPLMKAT
ncbi:hypothetical protein BHM03_00040103, partial [Ensete ventricosum]